jgi:hypothetical protein
LRGGHGIELEAATAENVPGIKLLDGSTMRLRAGWALMVALAEGNFAEEADVLEVGEVRVGFTVETVADADFLIVAFSGAVVLCNDEAIDVVTPLALRVEDVVGGTAEMVPFNLELVVAPDLCETDEDEMEGLG